MLTREKVPILFRTQWSPLSLPNLALWLDPTYGLYQERTGASATTPATADGDPVGTWVGRAAGGGLVYCTAASNAERPTLKLAVQNSRNAVLFDGTDDRLGSSVTDVNSDVSMIAAANPTNVTLERVIAATYNGTDGWEWYYFSSALNYFHNGGASKAAATGWQIPYAQQSGTSAEVRINGGTAGTSTGNVTGSGVGVRVGAWGSGGITGPFAGHIGDLIIVSRAITTAERQQLETWLNTRWGVY